MTHVTLSQHRRLVRIERTNRTRALGMGCLAEEVDLPALFMEKGGLCFCGKPIDLALKGDDPMGFALDHDIGLAYGGTHTKANCRPSHNKCNKAKADEIDTPRAAKTKSMRGIMHDDDATGQQKRRRQGKTKKINSNPKIQSRPFPGWRLFNGKAKRREDRP